MNNCLFALLLLFCAASPELAFTQQDTNRLLICKNAYVFLQHDTAFFEFRIADLPSFFEPYDTLVKDASGSYAGSIVSFRDSMGFFVANYKIPVSKRMHQKFRVFQVATKEQMQKWNFEHNRDKYNKMICDTRFSPPRDTSQQYMASMMASRQDLMDQFSLPQAGYTLVLEAYKQKYRLVQLPHKSQFAKPRGKK